jgi:hypothetical protein
MALRRKRGQRIGGAFACERQVPSGAAHEPCQDAGPPRRGCGDWRSSGQAPRRACPPALGQPCALPTVPTPVNLRCRHLAIGPTGRLSEPMLRTACLGSVVRSSERRGHRYHPSLSVPCEAIRPVNAVPERARGDRTRRGERSFEHTRTIVRLFEPVGDRGLRLVAAAFGVSHCGDLACRGPLMSDRNVRLHWCWSP